MDFQELCCRNVEVLHRAKEGRCEDLKKKKKEGQLDWSHPNDAFEIADNVWITCRII
jgi:hypothetical protein